MRKPKIAAAVAGTADSAVKSANRALACAASHVRLLWDVNAIQTAGTGENVAVLKVRNNSRHACTVSGIPTAVLHIPDFDWKLTKHSEQNHSSRRTRAHPPLSASATSGSSMTTHAPPYRQRCR